MATKIKSLPGAGASTDFLDSKTGAEKFCAAEAEAELSGGFSAIVSSGRPVANLPELLRRYHPPDSSENSPSNPTRLDGDEGVGEELNSDSEGL